jgi:hypothetical protein
MEGDWSRKGNRDPTLSEAGPHLMPTSEAR